MGPPKPTSTTSRKGPSPDIFVQQKTRKRAAAEVLEGPQPQKVRLARPQEFRGPAPPQNPGRPQEAGGPAPLKQAEAPKKPRPNFSKPDAEFVTIFAGPHQEMFRTHRDVITHDSSWFKDAFSRQLAAEGESKILILEDVEPAVFGLYNNWVYSQNIEHAPDAITNQVKKPDLMELAKLWSWAGVWRVPELQNQVMRMLIPMVLDGTKDISKNAEIWQFLRHAYATPDRTSLKTLAVEKLARMITSLVSLKDWVKDFPDGLLVDLTEVLARKLGAIPEDLRKSKVQYSLFLVKETE